MNFIPRKVSQKVFRSYNIFDRLNCLLVGMGLVQLDPRIFPKVLKGVMVYEVRRCQTLIRDLKIDAFSQVCYGSRFNDRRVAQTTTIYRFTVSVVLIQFCAGSFLLITPQ